MSIPLPIPTNQSYVCSYFFLPYRVQDRIFKSSVHVTAKTTFMEVKTQIADFAREFYHKPFTPYDFILARIDNSDFSLFQLFRDDSPTKVLEVDYSTNFIFAYEVPREVLNAGVIPVLTEGELRHVKQVEGGATNGGGDIEIEEEKKGEDEEMKEENRKYEVIKPEILFKPDYIQIPVKPLIRGKQTSTYSYSYSYSSYAPKFTNQNVIPRLFWFQKTASPFEVLK